MTATELRKLYPNASDDFIAENADTTDLSTAALRQAERTRVWRESNVPTLVDENPPTYQSLTLEGFRPKSINAVLGKHWTTVHRERTRTQQAVVLALTGKNPRMFAERVNVRIDTYYSHKPQDAQNPLSHKWLIDALIGLWFQDDSPEWINEVTTASHVDKAMPRVVVSAAVVEVPF